MQRIRVRGPVKAAWISARSRSGGSSDMRQSRTGTCVWVDDESTEQLSEAVANYTTWRRRHSDPCVVAMDALQGGSKASVLESDLGKRGPFAIKGRPPGLPGK